MHDPTKILAIKELRARCDVTLSHAKDAIEQYVAVHPGATWNDAMVDLASVLPRRVSLPKWDRELGSVPGYVVVQLGDERPFCLTFDEYDQARGKKK